MIFRSRRRLANLMMLKTARQIATVGFAFWFLFLSAAIHGLHKHDGGGCDTCDGEFCTNEPYSGTSKSGSPDVLEFESGNTPRIDGKLCRACVFLKLELERCAWWIALGTENLNSGSYDPEKDVCTSPFDCLLASPRGPPLSLT